MKDSKHQHFSLFTFHFSFVKGDIPMKKIILPLFLLCILTAGVFGQTKDGLPDLKAYEAAMYNVGRDIRLIRQAQSNNNRDIFDKIQMLDGAVEKYPPLERALQGYYVYDAEMCTSAAEAILPHSNPQLVDRQLGAYVYKDLIVYRFLADTAAVNRHEAVLQFITDHSNATRAEIEQFYRDNVRTLIAAVVDEEF